MGGCEVTHCFLYIIENNTYEKQLISIDNAIFQLKNYDSNIIIINNLQNRVEILENIINKNINPLLKDFI